MSIHRHRSRDDNELGILCGKYIVSGEFSVVYMYARLRFNWNEVDYSIFSTFLFMTNIFGKIENRTNSGLYSKLVSIVVCSLGVALAIGVLSHVFKIDDAIIGIIACASKVLSGIVFAFAPTKEVFYFGKRGLYCFKFFFKQSTPNSVVRSGVESRDGLYAKKNISN